MNNSRVLAISAGLFLVVLTVALACMSVGRLRIYSHATRFSAPESVDQTRAFLKEAESQINRLGPKLSPSDETEMMELSSGVYRRAIVHPELPEVWKTAADVINRRSRRDGGAVTAICGQGADTIQPTGPPDKFASVTFTAYQNCTISLDSDGNKPGRNRSTERKSTGDLLELRNVCVIYRGGEPIPIRTLSCIECAFELDLEGTLSPRGKSLIRGLLMTYSDNFAINVLKD